MCHGSTLLPLPSVLGEAADLLVRWRKCQLSPKGIKQAAKGLTLLPESHIPDATMSFHPCPWGLVYLSPSVSIPPCVVGKGMAGGG